ncbi:MAG: hypothetical protein N2258_03330 [Brevinematales bacterium]|nr:hypothetical protein [Brevinematales bacterium]
MNSFLTTRVENYNLSFYYREVKEVLKIDRKKLTRKRLNDSCFELPHLSYNNNWVPLFDIQLMLNIKNKTLPQYALLINDIEENIKFAICLPDVIEEIKIEKKDISIFPDFLLRKQKLTFIYGVIYIQNIPSLFLSFSDVIDPVEVANLIFKFKMGEKYVNNR